jgi:hypothetical protein
MMIARRRIISEVVASCEGLRNRGDWVGFANKKPSIASIDGFFVDAYVLSYA